MPEPYSIRTFAPADLSVCQVLYRDGLMGGMLADNDTGSDIQDIESAYMTPVGNHFWVADANGEVVGMIGVQRHEQHTGEIRRLRVRQDHRRRGIGSSLLSAALKFCQDHGYIKVCLDTFVQREAALKLFEKFRFKPARTRTVSGKEIVYFYLDLYTAGPPRP